MCSREIILENVEIVDIQVVKGRRKLRCLFRNLQKADLGYLVMSLQYARASLWGADLAAWSAGGGCPLSPSTTPTLIPGMSLVFPFAYEMCDGVRGVALVCTGAPLCVASGLSASNARLSIGRASVMVSMCDKPTMTSIRC